MSASNPDTDDGLQARISIRTAMHSDSITCLDELELDLLLYLEDRLVEHRGRVRADQMRPEEVDLARRWQQRGFIGFAPIRVEDMDYRQNNPATHCVSFSEEAWALAFQARRARAD